MMIFTKHEGDTITEDMIQDAAALFSSNYGVWGAMAQSRMSPFAKQGHRVRMSPERLKAECLPPSPARNIYLQVRHDDELIGNVFATRWISEGRNMCWITQLCVSSRYRNRGLATKLLLNLQEHEEDTSVGILSSHPFAILAVLRAFKCTPEKMDLSAVKDHAKWIMTSCPVNYVRTACLHGSLFAEGVKDGAISCADTRFFVDHSEPDEALAIVRNRGIAWPLGDLPEGHEFLAIVKSR